MGDLIEPAFRRAQDSAKEHLGTPLDKEPGQTMTYWLVCHDDFKRAVAEGIRSYLDDPEVLDEAREAVDPFTEDNRTTARDVLKAIGAKGEE